MAQIKDLAPAAIWRNFYALTQVPHPSGYLDKMREFLLNWAKEKGIEAEADEAGNIVLRKPATAGMENRQTVVMQAHMDMVPQKLKESTHDFENDPLETYIDGDWVKAKGTTLGADNGIGVATIMGIMEDNTLKHGVIEALITADEETGMYGVNGLKDDLLTGTILLNLDHESETDFVIGSAGGLNLTASLGYKEVKTDPTDIAIRISLKGLRGGHSGLEIAEGRANANKLMARMVQQAISFDEARLAYWQGGNMRNAIPRECEVIITIPQENEEELLDSVMSWQEVFSAEYAGIEESFIISAERTDLPKTEVPEDIQDNLVNAILACHNGVFRYIPGIPHIVETSSNLAIINIGEGKAEVMILPRSSCDTMMEFLVNSLTACFNMAGMKVVQDGEYGAWQPKLDSPIVKRMVEIYERMYDVKPAVEVVHAGLECSIIGGVYPQMDLVSFGPTMCSPHTPDERCNIPSVARYYEFVKQLLEEIPEK